MDVLANTKELLKSKKNVFNRQVRQVKHRPGRQVRQVKLRPGRQVR